MKYNLGQKHRKFHKIYCKFLLGVFFIFHFLYISYLIYLICAIGIDGISLLFLSLF